MANSRRRAPFLFLAPSFSVMLVVALVPFAISLALSLTSYNILTPTKTLFVGIKNYIDLFRDARGLNALRNTLVFVVSAVGIEFALALPLSYLIYISYGGSRGMNLIMLLVAFPMMVPKVTSGLVWRFLYNPLFGPINHLRGLLGMKAFAYLSNPHTALASVIFVDIWQWTPFLVLIFMAALEALPATVFESAEMDGASELRKFMGIAVPLLAPIFFVAITFRAIDALRTFDTIYVMTGGGPGISTETVDIFAYMIGITQGGRIAYASASAIILMVITVVVANIVTRRLYREDVTE